MDLVAARLILQRLLENLFGLTVAAVSQIDLGFCQRIHFFGYLRLLRNALGSRHRACPISRRIYECSSFRSFFFNDTAATEIDTLSLHDSLPIYPRRLEHIETTR